MNDGAVGKLEPNGFASELLHDHPSAAERPPDATDASGDLAAAAWTALSCALAAVAGTFAGTRALDGMGDATFRRIGSWTVLLLGAWHLTVWARLSFA